MIVRPDVANILCLQRIFHIAYFTLIQLLYQIMFSVKVFYHASRVNVFLTTHLTHNFTIAAFIMFGVRRYFVSLLVNNQTLHFCNVCKNFHVAERIHIESAGRRMYIKIIYQFNIVAIKTTTNKKQPRIKIIAIMNNVNKVCLIGDMDAGKSSLVTRYIKDYYDDANAEPTIGASFNSIYVDISRYLKEKHLLKKEVKLSVWDTAGQERYRGMMGMYLRGANVILVCIPFIPTILELNSVLNKYNVLDYDHAKVVIVITKIDTILDDTSAFRNMNSNATNLEAYAAHYFAESKTYSKLEEYVKDMGYDIMANSSKYDFNVKELFEYAGKLCYDTMEQMADDPSKIFISPKYHDVSKSSEIDKECCNII